MYFLGNFWQKWDTVSGQSWKQHSLIINYSAVLIGKLHVVQNYLTSQFTTVEGL